ncbi:hypothetical protein BST81_20835 [Leptolyngbya sp. 'hensonii']|nr:hypothetical protein BST81_20835 [Leptolyngbya sp. 'hensonii']
MVSGAVAPLVAPAPAGAVAITNGEYSGFVQGSSRIFTFRNQSKRNSPFEKARGEEYTFTARAGDELEFQVDPEDGSTLQTILVLIAVQTGKQVVFVDKGNMVRYKAPTAGAYKLLVLAKGNTRGRYILYSEGIGQAAVAAQPDQIMADVLKLRVVGCGVPNVARVKFGNEERCTRDIDPGLYTYDDASRSLKIVDTRRDTIGQRLQLSMLEKCPPAGTTTVKINVLDPQDGQRYVYCATPNRYVSAGEYSYDLTADRLQPVTTGSTPTTPTTTQSDERRVLLQRDYGLTTLDACPTQRTSLVVVAFPDPSQATQGYVYCAQPNRLVQAGEYVYNNKTGDLEVARKAEQCTVSLGGVCIVK